MSSVPLNHYLHFFDRFFAMENVSEICINRPHELWIEQKGEFLSFDIEELDIDFLWQFARLVAEANDREISREYPTLSSTLPNGLRVQFVVEPACARGSFICSIRQHAVKEVLLDHYFKQDLKPKEDGNELLKLYQNKQYQDFLKLAVLKKKNIIISGGTSTGKTTFLNALLKEIPLHERLITIETDREVKSNHKNSVHLLAAEEGISVANINMLGLLKAALRLRPDRILVSELRAEEAFPYLRAINSGHPGSITTLHADSPQTVFDQLAFMALQSGVTLSRQELVDYAKSIVPIVVQIKRLKGERYISEIYFNEASVLAAE